ncbi:type III secretion system export apparatus subunit SctV [Imhoffiella purpurea]|uniref:Type III secretion inner membrane channel protein (LcrD,HrcV,EscV,SsaV) n=1 Tax=Imhoffiella purpurea TaxID=1249627 RepID=W9V893_9GAMM|nr:type III secretion system export apparatus subunit SctV [Imhoffiella purpurea]EXJ15649.1 Type III secretion inner membrane channel protein (LcrD,HrcV,EscV,SsaV) [Imhoffiella purpurea]
MLALAQTILGAVTRRSDVLLAVSVVMILFMMIVPLPTLLVDALIAVNMTSGIILLMVAVYIPSPLSFSVFPAILLITTLFRLALNISTTRLILLNADAGDIIFAFGDFVVGSNFVVGAVLFLIITIVQFVVITKGAERVAEVSARFSLDAMPGKQMSIDGDMRAGLIDMDEARRRRGLVEKESQLYGSMDGAMKFVKGDAIAGLIITSVNLIGGIAIGSLQQGMTAGEAVQVYSILSIGDGLVSQIPGLLISITAGIIVTRVSTDESSNLGSDIGSQVLAQPKALLIAGSLLFLFAAIPGFPYQVFVPLGLILLALSLTLIRVNQAQLAASAGAGAIPAMAPAGRPAKAAPKRPSGGVEDEFSLTVPLMIDVDASLERVLRAEELNEALIEVRRALYLDLGVPFPGIHLRYNANLADGAYQILIQETPMAHGWLRPGYVLCREEAAQLGMLGIAAESGERFLPGVDSLWVEARHRDSLAKAGIATLDLPRVLTFHLSFVLKKYAPDFVGIQETRYLLGQMEAGFGELVKEVQRVLPIQKITEIFQRLVSEEISIRNLRAILEALVEWGQKEKDSVLLCEYIRGSLKRYISYKYSSGQNVLPAYLLGPEVEETIRGSIRQTSSGSYLALDPAVAQRFVACCKQAIGELRPGRSRPVIVVSMDIRRYVRKLIELELYEVPVLSYQELTQEISVQPLDRILL